MTRSATQRSGRCICIQFDDGRCADAFGWELTDPATGEVARSDTLIWTGDEWIKRLIHVGIHNPPTNLRTFPATLEGMDEAVAFVSTLDGVEDGIYYIDTPFEHMRGEEE